jgi:RNA polymerase sigma factor (sigma-70 family)
VVTTAKTMDSQLAGGVPSSASRSRVALVAGGPSHLPLELDTDQLRKFRQGDRQILVEIYRDYGEVVYRFLRERLRSPADARDLGQEVFITAFKEDTRLRFSGSSTIQSFLLGIARNLLMHHFRAARVRDAGAEEVGRASEMSDQEVPPVDHSMEHQEVGKILEDFIASLEDRDRDFFRRHMIERPPRRVTAEAFAMSEDQVRYLERKLRDKALKYLKQVGYLDAAGAQLQRAAALS